MFMHTKIIASVVLALVVLFFGIWGERAMNENALPTDRILGIERCVWGVGIGVLMAVASLVLAVMVLAGGGK